VDDKRIYSFDPGKITGVAVGNYDGTLYAMSQWKEDELFKYLAGIKDAGVFIVENFTIRPNKASSFIWSDMQVIQIIGALKFCAHTLKVDLVLQEPSVKSIGYRWAGIESPKNHAISHQTDAYAHLTYYWVNRLTLQPPAMKKLQEERAAHGESSKK
jgi:hypothetical protein